MLDKVKAEWQDLKQAPAGQRFVKCYERHQAREAPWLKPILFFAAVFSFVIGVVLAFVPGPAILFFAISGALLAAESRPVASAFDKVELFARHLFDRFRAKRRKRQARAETRVGRIDKHEAAILQRAAAAAGLAQTPQVPARPESSEVPAHQPVSSATEYGVPQAAGPVDMSKLQLPDAPAQPSVHPANAHAAPVDMSKLQLPDAPAQPSVRPANVHAAPVDMSKLQVMSAAPQTEIHARLARELADARNGDAPQNAAAVDMWRLQIPDASTQSIPHQTHSPQAAPDSPEPMPPRVEDTRDAWETSAPPFLEHELGAPEALHAAATRHVHIEQNTVPREILKHNTAPANGREPLPLAASTKQGHAPMQVRAVVTVPPTPVAETMKMWTSEAAQAVAFQNAQSMSRRPSSPPGPAVVKLAPPAIIVGQKRSRPTGPRGDRRATPPPPPRKLRHSPSSRA